MHIRIIGNAHIDILGNAKINVDTNTKINNVSANTKINRMRVILITSLRIIAKPIFVCA